MEKTASQSSRARSFLPLLSSLWTGCTCPFLLMRPEHHWNQGWHRQWFSTEQELTHKAITQKVTKARSWSVRFYILTNSQGSYVSVSWLLWEKLQMFTHWWETNDFLLFESWLTKSIFLQQFPDKRGELFLKHSCGMFLTGAWLLDERMSKGVEGAEAM